jgi:hypothetical protein
MRNLVIIDNRKSIIDRAKEAGFDGIYGDYFNEIVKIPNHVICSASNPAFTYAGGFDRQLAENFPFYCEEKRSRYNENNERIGNICFLISVDNRIQANDELVRDALIFARDNTSKNETLCLMGIGCMIGGLDERVFIEIISEVFEDYKFKKSK